MLSFSTQEVKREPNIGIITATAREGVMHPVLIDKVLQLIP